MNKNKPTIAVKKGKTEHRVVLKGANNRTVAVTETYKTKTGANKAAVRLKELASKAKVKKAK
jgi:uncharacterized protein YegP (UPF0339 family)